MSSVHKKILLYKISAQWKFSVSCLCQLYSIFFQVCTVFTVCTMCTVYSLIPSVHRVLNARSAHGVHKTNSECTRILYSESA
jgi:hypothetical protein